MIRPAREADLDALAELDAVLFGVDAWSRASFVGSLTSTIVGLQQQNRPARGHNPTIVGLGPAQPPPLDGYAVLAAAGDVADLQRVGVRRECRRAGLATALLDAGLGWACEQGLGRVLLEVSDANAAARDFYAAAGFTQIDRRRGYYRDGTDALVLERPVAPPVTP